MKAGQGDELHITPRHLDSICDNLPLVRLRAGEKCVALYKIKGANNYVMNEIPNSDKARFLKGCLVTVCEGRRLVFKKSVLRVIPCGDVCWKRIIEVLEDMNISVFLTSNNQENEALSATLESAREWAGTPSVCAVSEAVAKLMNGRLSTQAALTEEGRYPVLHVVDGDGSPLHAGIYALEGRARLINQNHIQSEDEIRDKELRKRRKFTDDIKNVALVNGGIARALYFMICKIEFGKEVELTDLMVPFSESLRQNMEKYFEELERLQEETGADVLAICSAKFVYLLNSRVIKMVERLPSTSSMVVVIPQGYYVSLLAVGGDQLARRLLLVIECREDNCFYQPSDVDHDGKIEEGIKDTIALYNKLTALVGVYVTTVALVVGVAVKKEYLTAISAAFALGSNALLKDVTGIWIMACNSVIRVKRANDTWVAANTGQCPRNLDYMLMVAALSTAPLASDKWIRGAVMMSYMYTLLILHLNLGAKESMKHDRVEGNRGRSSLRYATYCVTLAITTVNNMNCIPLELWANRAIVLLYTREKTYTAMLRLLTVLTLVLNCLLSVIPTIMAFMLQVLSLATTNEDHTGPLVEEGINTGDPKSGTGWCHWDRGVRVRAETILVRCAPIATGEVLVLNREGVKDYPLSNIDCSERPIANVLVLNDAGARTLDWRVSGIAHLPFDVSEKLHKHRRYGVTTAAFELFNQTMYVDEVTSTLLGKEAKRVYMYRKARSRRVARSAPVIGNWDQCTS
jgi:hypothetical protein